MYKVISLLILATAFLIVANGFSGSISEQPDLHIAVVGAGASGLTAAYNLRKLGYNDVTVFEADERVGGKVNTVNYDGRPYEMGAVWQMNEYKTVLEMARDVGVNIESDRRELIQVDPDGEFRSSVTSALVQFGIFNLGSSFLNYKRLTSSTFRGIYRQGFADLPADLHMNMSDFLSKYHLQAMGECLKPILIGSGYGYYEEVPAMYYMKLINMQLDGQIAASLGSFFPWRKSVALYAPKGYQGIWERIATRLKVRLKSPVTQISRSLLDNKPRILLTSGSTTEIFDRVIISTPLDVAKKFLDLSLEEKELASQVKSYRYVATLFRGKNLPKLKTVFFPEHTIPSANGHVLAVDNEWPENDIYLSEQQVPWGAELSTTNSFLTQDLASIGGEVDEILLQKEWKYFPHVNTEDLDNGFYEKMEEQQGTLGTYYVGALMSFETVENAASYAKDLVVNRFH